MNKKVFSIEAAVSYSLLAVIVCIGCLLGFNIPKHIQAIIVIIELIIGYVLLNNFLIETDGNKFLILLLFVVFSIGLLFGNIFHFLAYI